MLVLVDGWLVAVLVRLSDQHDSHSGHWFLESGYGRLADVAHTTFDDLAAATAWFTSHLADRSPFDQWERRNRGNDTGSLS